MICFGLFGDNGKCSSELKKWESEVAAVPMIFSGYFCRRCLWAMVVGSLGGVRVDQGCRQWGELLANFGFLGGCALS